MSEEPGTTITFPDGLPGFEGCRQYVLIASPAMAPFTCLRGLGPDAPSFLALDPRQVVDGYRCDLSDGDRSRVQAGDEPLLWLALVSVSDAGARVNLRAPLVINPSSMRGLQVLDGGSKYSIDHPLAGSPSTGPGQAPSTGSRRT